MIDKILDVIIVGGGPAGCATALSLFKSSNKLSCIIFDDADSTAFKIGESLPPESSQLFQYLCPSLSGNLATAVADGTHLLCTGNASAWASPALDERHAIMNPFGHGYHLNRAAFDELLRRCIVDCGDGTENGSIRIIKGTFKSVEREAGGYWAVYVDVDGQEMPFFAKWVVDATGRKASVATKLGARISIPDPLLAFYALFTGPVSPDAEADNDHRTLIEATADGWFYSALLSLSPPTRLVAFHTLPTHPAAKRARRCDGFLDLIQMSSVHISAVIERCGYEISRPGGSGGFPRCTAAGSSCLDRACDSWSSGGWVAVGDAAMAFDPLSSQGMMTALEMGCHVGTVLASWLVNDEKQKIKVSGEIEGVYQRIREEYMQQRAYYYGLVRRFHGEEFWSNLGNRNQAA